MTDKTREAFEAHCSKYWGGALHIRDMAGSEKFGEYVSDRVQFAWLAWQAATARAAAEAVRVCEEQFDHDEQDKADAASRTAKGVSSQLQRLRHWSTVSTYNAAVSRCITAIKEALK